MQCRSNIQSRWLLWLTHLKTAGGDMTEHDSDQLLTAIRLNDSMGKGKKLNYKQVETKDMKAKNQILKGLAMLLLFFAGTLGVMAQTSTTPTQSVCPGTEPYKIIPDNAGNTFLWSITPGTSGVEWTISNPTAAITDIVWANPTTPQVYTVTFKEIVPTTGCSDQVTLVVTVNPRPDAPIGSDLTECEKSPIQTLTATATAPTGATVVWYDAATGGNIVASPTLSAVGSITYYAESVLGSCSSLTRTAVKLTIEPAPAAPTASDVTDCEQNPLQTLTATATPPTGATVVWYDAATGGNIVASPTLSTVGTITYYAQSNLGSCTSLTRTPVKLTILPAPAAPTASDLTECEKSPIQTITATATPPAGATVVWYDAATGGNVVASPTLSAVGSITYYAESVLGSCKSLTRTAVKLTIEPAPIPTLTGPTPICAGTTNNVYTTEPGMTNYTWAISAGGTITAGGTATDNTVTVTWNTAGAQTVSVNYTNAKGCAGLAPTIKTVTVDPLPNTSPIYHN